MKDKFLFLLEKFIYPIFVATVFGVIYLLIQINRLSGIDPGIFYILVSFFFLGIFAGTFKEMNDFNRLIIISMPKYYNDTKFKTVIQIISGFIGILSFFGIPLAYDDLVLIIIALVYWFVLREVGIVIGYKIISIISLLYGMINKEHLKKINNLENIIE